MSSIIDLFQNYKIEALRLETRPFYKVDGEWENFQHYLHTGELIRDEDLQNHIKETKKKLAAGIDYIRLRVVEEPLNDYQIFEIKAGYIPYLESGGKVFFINRAKYNTILYQNPQYKIVDDFWLFDRKDVVIMNYNDANEWTGSTIGSSNDTALRMNFADFIIKNSYSLKDYLATHQGPNF